MRTVLLQVAVLTAVLPVLAVERVFNFGEVAPGQAPPGFLSTVAGEGEPGDWKVILDDVSREAPAAKGLPGGQQAVLAQLARGATNAQFPLLILDGETYKDFKFSVRFRIDGGVAAQTIGLVFRYQNQSNFYAVGASSLAKNLRCLKLVNGEWKPPVGTDLDIRPGTWHTLSVECEGTRVVCSLDGKEAIKLVDATANPTGKIGFWTQSDSIGCFADAKVTGQPRQILARELVSDALKKYPRLLGLRVYVLTANGRETAIVASGDGKDIGQAGGQTELEVIRQGTVHFEKDRKSARVTMPLRDRNGDPIAAVCVVLKSSLGQTRDNTLMRARPVVQLMQGRVKSLEDLLR